MKLSGLILSFFILFMGILAYLCWGGLLFCAIGVEEATTEITDVGRYEEILTEYWGVECPLVSHFPPSIPSDARHVAFSFLPAFMQGGAHIQLRYSLSADSISTLYDQFSKMKTKSFIGGDRNDHVNMSEGMPTTYFYTSGTSVLKFPDEYEIIIFDELPNDEKRAEGISWNHGQSHGVAINKAAHEIVYWAEAW